MPVVHPSSGLALLLSVLPISGCADRSRVATGDGVAVSAILDSAEERNHGYQAETELPNQTRHTHRPETRMAEHPDRAGLSGSYLLGDGLGVNVNLLLTKSGEFHCLDSSCGTTYGESSGSWSVEGSTISLRPLMENGSLRQTTIRSLDVWTDNQTYFLVEGRKREDFAASGPTTTNSFVRLRTR